jgi:hypothetical protein
MDKGQICEGEATSQWRETNLCKVDHDPMYISQIGEERPRPKEGRPDLWAEGHGPMEGGQICEKKATAQLERMAASDTTP